MSDITSIYLQIQAKINSFLRDVYNWMGIGLLLSACTARFVENNELIFQIDSNTEWFFVGFEIILVFFISKNIKKLSSVATIILFLLYAALNGATISIIFAIYSTQSTAPTFFICAATFGLCSSYKWITQRDLTSIRHFVLMGFIGIFIASIINILFKNNLLQVIISFIGVLFFTGLTGYDTQKLKAMAMAKPSNLSTGVTTKGSILGALVLYLDFILIFPAAATYFWKKCLKN